MMRCLLHRRLPGGVLIAWRSACCIRGRRASSRSARRGQQTTVAAGGAIDKHVEDLLNDWDFDEEPTRSLVPPQLRGNASELVDAESLDEFGNTVVKPSVPAEVRCFDTARIYLKAGSGGNGCVAFHREKFVSKGGPSGGDGGHGGDVWAVADGSLNSLLSFRRQIHWRAKKGVAGQGSKRRGADGEDMFIPVPPGTIIRWKGVPSTEAALAELVKAGEKALLLRGGRGGRGNASFKSGKVQAPQLAELGEDGPEAWVDLELKLVADVGIIGIPNAGKSTLLSKLSAAKPKIADYPFTTLMPNLGVCDLDYETTVFADVPGLLEGAAQGIGLGHQFLKHCQRCKVLIHVIDGTSEDPLGDFEAIQLELQLFSPELRTKPQVVVYNKMDIPDAAERWREFKTELISVGVGADEVLSMSAIAGDGVTPVIRKARQLLSAITKPDEWGRTPAPSSSVPKTMKTNDERIDDFWIEQDRGRTPTMWIIHGRALERFTQMTNWDYYEALKRFQRVLDASGVSASLRKMGVKEGDDVVIGSFEFTWRDDQSEKALYGAWIEGRKAAGKARKGRSKWPHVGG